MRTPHARVGDPLYSVDTTTYATVIPQCSALCNTVMQLKMLLNSLTPRHFDQVVWHVNIYLYLGVGVNFNNIFKGFRVSCSKTFL